MNIPFPPEHYYQNQGMVPKTGPVECVTTSVVMVMNMLKDRLAKESDLPALPDIGVREYVQELDGMGLGGLRYRFPSDFLIKAARGWMHPVWQVPGTLRRFAGALSQKYGRSFQMRQTSGNCLEDVAQNLLDGNYVIVHGLWQVTDKKEMHYRFGGIPHTMLPVEIDRLHDRVRLLNPAEPPPDSVNPDDPSTYPQAVLDEMTNQEFLAFWGRKSFLNLYTKPYTMTVVIPET